MIKYSEIKNIDSTLEVVFGDPELLDLEGISSALRPEKNTFIFIKNKKYFQDIGRLAHQKDYTKTGIVFEKKYYDLIRHTDDFLFVKEQFAWGAISADVNRSMCLLSKPFYDLKFGRLNYFVDGRQMGNADVDPTAQIAQNVFIGSNVFIGKNVVIMPGSTILPEVIIGDDTIIFPNVTIYPYCKIGKKCRVHSSAVIGADGFGYNFYDGEHHKIWHLGGVIIEDNVEIGGATMVDAGAFIPTLIGEGTKLDNFCQISHNVQVGKHCVLAGGAGSAGSGEIGDYCAFGARAGLAPGSRVGNATMLGANAIVGENTIWPDKSILAGHPARPLKQWLRAQAMLRKLMKEN